MKKHLAILYTICFLGILVCSSIAQNSRNTNDENIKTLFLVFDKLKSGNYDKNALYTNYFYHSPAKQQDRSQTEINYYKDTLFPLFNNMLMSAVNYNILPLQQAKTMAGDSIVEYNYYYQGQKNNIYVLLVTTKNRKYDFVHYFLMIDGKIVSMEGYTLDKGFIRWR
ncbi:MAG: hypothetical protein V4580_05025 [Bacteroidota bacterium]